jgi:FkbM family methyltransferase
VSSRLGSLPGLRRIRDLPAVVRAWAIAYRSRLVRERLRFFLREWLGARLTARYRLRNSTVDVHLRHGTSDLDILEEVFGLGFYRMPAPVEAALGAGPIQVLDLGGHIGLFGAWALRELPGAVITSVEADPANAAVLQRTITGAPDRWRLVAAAAADRDGEMDFLPGAFAESRLEQGPGSVRVPTVDALELMNAADLVKIDVEGGEWPILGDPRLATARVRALVLEYHPLGAPEDDPRRAAHALLERAGFETQEIPGAPVGAGMLWAWRPLPAS